MNSMTTLSIYKTRRGASLLSKEKIPFVFLCILFSLLWYFTTRCETIESLDLHRYYENAILWKDAPVRIFLIGHLHAPMISFISYYYILH